MDGRTEHGLLVDDKTKKILLNMPSYVTDYYYTLTSSKEPCTRREYIIKIKAFLDYVKCDITEITDSMIAKYFNHLNNQSIKQRGKELSSAYQQQIYAALNGFFKYLYKKHIIKDNPMELYEYPKSKDEINKVALNIDELNNMLKLVKSGKYTKDPELWTSRDYLILYMFMNTGMRCEMLREINVTDLDFDNHIFSVVAKGGKKTEYAITDRMAEAINEWLLVRSEILGGEYTDALFISYQKTRMTYVAINRLVSKYSKAIGHKITPHKLRASFITNFYEASNHDIEATREAAGHRNANITLKHYIVSQSGSRQKAQNFMDSVLY